jgi:hypothetical protein
MRGMSARSIRWLPCLVPAALAAVVAPGRAAAQDAAKDEHDKAVTYYMAGRRYFEQKDCKQAVPQLVESLRHEDNVGARYTIADCSSADGHNAEAWNQYKGAEQLAVKNNDERARSSHENAAALEPKVLKLRLVLPKTVPDFTVKIDGKNVDKQDYTLLETGYAVEPGQAHSIEVTANNRAPWTKGAVQGAAGAELPAIAVDLGAPLAPEGADVGSGQRTAGLVVGGVGVVGVALGAVFGIIAMGKKSAYTDATKDSKLCQATPSGTICDPSVSEKRTAISGPATISTIGFIAGGALLAGGAILFFAAPKGANSPTMGRLRLAPAVGPGNAGALLTGSF